MSTPFLGQISIFSFNFAPKGWALCNGQILAISQNQALFSLLGTMYGGDGRQTFALPNLQGKLALGFGQGSGLNNRVQGEVGGEQNHTLINGEMPPHNHTANFAAKTSPGADSLDPTGKLWVEDPNGNVTFATAGNEVLAPAAIGNTGGSQPHSNMQPYLVVSFCIAVVGIFPTRN